MQKIWGLFASCIKMKLTKLFKNKYFLLSIGVLIFGVLVNQISSIYLEAKYGENLPVLNDILLDNLPYLKIQWLYDVIPLILMLV